MARTAATSDHFDGAQFRNLDGAPAGGKLADVLRWKLRGGPLAPWPTRTDKDMVAPRLPGQVEPGRVAATFIGHSTFLLQFTGGFKRADRPGVE